MLRSLSVGLLCIAFGVPAIAQDKKDTPKKKVEKIVIADLEKVKADPDFAVQGEYVGEATSARRKHAAQVVAKGGGQFDVKVFAGGLPGDGWDGKTPLKGTAKRGDDGAVAITGKEYTGTIADGKLTIKGETIPETKLGKVERKSPTQGAKPPEGAIVLFGGPGDEKNWNGGKILELSDGKFLKMGTATKNNFQNFKAHVEFRTPWMPNSFGQARGNSGVILQKNYEIQVLDSFGLEGKDNECGAIYSLHKPLVNMCFPPLIWQTYDIEFIAAHLDGDKKVKLARVTVLHNGVKIQDDEEIKRPTAGGTQSDKPTPGPILLQDHGNPVAYKNIWLVEAK